MATKSAESEGRRHVGEEMGQFGQELRKEREGRGVTVDYICAVTKVSSRHVEALEEGRYRDLPGGIFRKGIVRGYIHAVGLEEADWIARFEASLREATASMGDEDWTAFAENVRRNRDGATHSTDKRWLGVLLMLAVVAAGCWLTWHYVLHGRLR